MPEKFDRIFLFDDCDASPLETWNNLEQGLSAALMLLFKLLCGTEDYGSLLDADNCVLQACLGEKQYTIDMKTGEDVQMYDCGWLKDRVIFERKLNEVIETAKAHHSLFLIDWTLNNIEWTIDAEQRTGKLVLNELYKNRTEITGVVTCYTSAIQDAPFQKEYPEQKDRFSDKDSKLLPMKMLWRWNDIASTEYSLYRKLWHLLRTKEG